MGYFVAMLLGYLLGCSNLAYYLSKAAKKDIRKDGSGNLGASNATILFGWRAGVAVAVHDAGKALLAVILAKLLFPHLEYGSGSRCGGGAGPYLSLLFEVQGRQGYRVLCGTDPGAELETGSGGAGHPDSGNDYHRLYCHRYLQRHCDGAGIYGPF